MRSFIYESHVHKRTHPHTTTRLVHRTQNDWESSYVIRFHTLAVYTHWAMVSGVYVYLYICTLFSLAIPYKFLTVRRIRFSIVLALDCSFGRTFASIASLSLSWCCALVLSMKNVRLKIIHEIHSNSNKATTGRFFFFSEDMNRVKSWLLKCVLSYSTFLYHTIKTTPTVTHSIARALFRLKSFIYLMRWERVRQRAHASSSHFSY